MKANSYSIYLQNATKAELQALSDDMALNAFRNDNGLDKALFSAIARESGRRSLMEAFRKDIERLSGVTAEMSKELEALAKKAEGVMS